MKNNAAMEDHWSNNPQAFPNDVKPITDRAGMTLRDYFAARALQNFRDQIGSQSDQEWFDKVAEGAYRMADAMLKARGA
jgi:hypothetical protein